MGEKLSSAKNEIIAQSRRYDAFDKLSDEQKANHLEKNRTYCDPSKTDNYSKLENLAAEIKLRVKICKKEIFKIGELLTEAKRLSGHGNFKQWVEDNCDFSYETANNFMNAYKYCLGHFEFLETIPSSIIYMVSSPNFPSDLREYLFTTGEIKLINVRDELRDVLEKYRNGELDVTSPKLDILFKAKRDDIGIERYIKLLDSFQKDLSKYFDIFENLDHPIRYTPKKEDQEKWDITEMTEDGGNIRTEREMEFELYPEVPPESDPCVVILNCEAEIEKIKDDLKSLRERRIGELFEEMKK